MAINPFVEGNKKQRKPAVEIFKNNFGIGIREFDRGFKVWNDSRLNELGEPDPGFEHVPVVSTEVIVEFSTNEGKGTGKQEIPASEFRDYVSVLEGIVESNYQRDDGAGEQRYIPCGESAAQSWRMVKPKIQKAGPDGKERLVTDQTAEADIVSVRAISGKKGAKPIQVHKSEFPQVVALLRQAADNLDEYEEQSWASYNNE